MHNAFKRAAKYLHKKSNFNSQDLKHKEVKPLITETFNVLKNAVNTGITTEVPAAMLQKLQTDVFVFSGMKTYAQLKEASLLLLDENNQIKPYAKFEQDVLKIDNTYNQNYLQAEHQHAIAAAQSAAQYNEYMQDAESYNLQIRTAGDDKVRASHAELNGITLPANDPFWNTHYTPFDWRCRCRIIQVLKNKYPVTDNGIANAAAQQAIPEMFKYNPAVQGVIFPPKHPYYPQHCNGVKLNVSKLIGFATWLLNAESDRCKAKMIIEGMLKGGSNEADYKKSIYNKPVEEQYQTVFKNKDGKKVEVHQLANETRSKYSDIIYAAKAMKNGNISVKVQPEIDVKERAARQKLMPGYNHYSANPDLLTEHGKYVDVKAPKKFKNINGLAVYAAKKQNAEALIIDKNISIDSRKINVLAKRIFMDKNYTKDVVHFVVKGKYYSIHR